MTQFISQSNRGWSAFNSLDTVSTPNRCVEKNHFQTSSIQVTIQPAPCFTRNVSPWISIHHPCTVPSSMYSFIIIIILFFLLLFYFMFFWLFPCSDTITWNMLHALRVRIKINNNMHAHRSCSVNNSLTQLAYVGILVTFLICLRESTPSSPPPVFGTYTARTRFGPIDSSKLCQQKNAE